MELEIFDKSGIPKYTPEELANLIGLIAIIDADLARERFFGVRSLDVSLEDYICDHDFTD